MNEARKPPLFLLSLHRNVLIFTKYHLFSLQSCKMLSHEVKIILLLSICTMLYTMTSWKVFRYQVTFGWVLNILYNMAYHINCSLELFTLIGSLGVVERKTLAFPFLCWLRSQRTRLYCPTATEFCKYTSDMVQLKAHETKYMGRFSLNHFKTSIHVCLLVNIITV